MERSREQLDRDLDEALEETFPASDAPANTVEMRLLPREIPASLIASTSVRDDDDRQRFELVVEGETAFLSYERGPGTLTLVHTEVPEGIRRRGVGTALVEAAIARGRADGLRIIAQCAFAKDYLRKHPSRA